MAVLTYALDEGGALVHVDAVAKGAKCVCHCPHCNAVLYAKNRGLKRVHHFAHTKGCKCDGTDESTLHKLAKKALQELGRIMLPPSIEGDFPSGSVRIFNVEVEKWYEQYKIRPDAVCILENGELILIEFYVSHKVDNQKWQIIVDNHLKCLEIDINHCPLNIVAIKEFLAESSHDRHWIFDIPSSPVLKSCNTSNYVRNPVYGKAMGLLKEIFVNGTIKIYPFAMFGTQHDESVDLREMGYDMIVSNIKYLGFRCDLLLFGSHRQDIKPIAINIRGRRRSEGFRCPEGLLIIDIILRSVNDDSIIREKLQNGELAGNYGINVKYYGFDDKVRPRTNERLTDYNTQMISW